MVMGENDDLALSKSRRTMMLSMTDVKRRITDINEK